MRELGTALTTTQDLARVGETLRSVSRAFRGPGADDETDSFAAALAAASDETGQDAAPDLTRGGRRTGDARTPESQALAKRSRDHATGAQIRTPLAPTQPTSQASTSAPVLSQREQEVAAQAEALAQASAAARGADAASTAGPARATEPPSTLASTPAGPNPPAQPAITASARSTEPVSDQPPARATAQEIPPVPTRSNDPLTVAATGRATASENTTAAPHANDPIAAPANGRVTTNEGPSSMTGADVSPLTIKEYPKPSKDRAGVLNWTSVTPPTNGEVSQLIDQAKSRQAGWVTFSVDPDRVDDYDNLAKRLSAAGLQPIARIQDTEGDLPTADVADTVQHLRGLGVRYFELFDGANLNSQSPDNRVDVTGYAERWLRSAQTVVANGGLPGIGALSQDGDYDDLGFMRQLLSTLKANGGQAVLGRSWMAMQSTAPGGTATTEDVGDTLDRARWFDRLNRNTLGSSIPILATVDPSGGSEPLTGASSTSDQTAAADQAERALRSRQRQTPSKFWDSRGSQESHSD
jgi:hypothetical protein